MLNDCCAECGCSLAGCETIWACEGYLFCSRKCGIMHYMRYYDNIKHGASYAIKHFDEYAEELDPKDIGIE